MPCFLSELYLMSLYRCGECVDGLQVDFCPFSCSSASSLLQEVEVGPYQVEKGCLGYRELKKASFLLRDFARNHLSHDLVHVVQLSLVTTHALLAMSWVLIISLLGLSKRGLGFLIRSLSHPPSALRQNSLSIYHRMECLPWAIPEVCRNSAVNYLEWCWLSQWKLNIFLFFRSQAVIESSEAKRTAQIVQFCKSNI